MARFVFGGDLDTISILPMDEDRRSGSSVGASLSNAVHPASKKQMIELLQAPPCASAMRVNILRVHVQALFHQCVRVLHNHSFVVRTILYEKEKAEVSISPADGAMLGLAPHPRACAG